MFVSEVCSQYTLAVDTEQHQDHLFFVSCLVFFLIFQIFDMEEFKSHIGIQLRSGQFDEQRLQLLSTVCISFCHDTDDPLLTPCWLCIINLMALDMIGNPDGM